MRFIICIMVALFPFAVSAQNVGIGIADPKTKLDVVGDVRIAPEYISPVNSPTEGQTVTMVNGNTYSMRSTDSVVRVYDPGGPNGDYIANLTANFFVFNNATANSYLELLIEDINLGTGDSLILLDGQSATSTSLLRLGNYTASNITIRFSGNAGHCIFKSNTNASVGSGFSLFFKRRFLKTNTYPELIGNSFMFYGDKGALRSGNFQAGNTESIGQYSTSLGYNNIASSDGAVALGSNCTASYGTSVAIGFGCTASAVGAVAIGSLSNATATGAVALGFGADAEGMYSVALGRGVTATGTGSFIFGDNSASSTNGSSNRMYMRFSNGYYLYTSSATNVGVFMQANANSWSSISDSTKKENFLPADGQSFLAKIGEMKLGSWNYKQHDKTKYRHYGPMAQEFFSNFGNDSIGTIGNDTTIASADIDGVMMIAIQALVKENEKLKSKNEELENRLQKLEMIMCKQSPLALQAK